MSRPYQPEALARECVFGLHSRDDSLIGELVILTCWRFGLVFSRLILAISHVKNCRLETRFVVNEAAASPFCPPILTDGRFQAGEFNTCCIELFQIASTPADRALAARMACCRMCAYNRCPGNRFTNSARIRTPSLALRVGMGETPGIGCDNTNPKR